MSVLCDNQGRIQVGGGWVKGAHDFEGQLSPPQES